MTLRLIYDYARPSDRVGIVIRSGRVPNKFFPSAPAQTTIEVFRRLRVAQISEMTPSLRFLVEPAGNRAVDDIAVLRLSTRLTICRR